MKTKKQKLQATAFEEISLMAQKPVHRRKRSMVLQTGSAEAVPAPLRALLEAIHQGRCQICSFTRTTGRTVESRSRRKKEREREE